MMILLQQLGVVGIAELIEEADIRSTENYFVIEVVKRTGAGQDYK